MNDTPDPRVLLLVGMAALAGCKSDHRTLPADARTSQNRALQADGGPSASLGDTSAGASLLASAGVTVLHGNRPRFVSSSPVAERLRHAAEASIRVWTLESGAGPHLLWSTRNDRLAREPNAPKDGNDNGTNLDETLAAEWAKFGELAEGRVPTGMWPALALFREADPHYPQPVDVPNRKTDFSTLRWDRAKTSPVIDAAGIGRATLAGILRAERLLAERRGNAPGLTPEQGNLGLLLVQQALAAEEFLLGNLAFDGTVLGPLPDPDTYDPGKGLRWFPAAVTVIEEAQPQGLPPKLAGIVPAEPASELAAQAALLHGFAELAWMAAADQPNPNYRDVFQGRPFGKLPGKGKGEGSPAGVPGGPDAGPLEEVTYERHVAGFMVRHGCASCHGGSGDFFATTYQGILRGGAHRVTNPTVVPGNSAGSLLWQIISLDRPPVSRRMPDGGPRLPQSEIDLIRDWIDQGAKEKSSTVVPAPAVPGRATARVIVRNLAAMHRDVAAGVLVDRHDGQSRSVHVDAAAAGAVLSALAAAAEVVPDEVELLPMLQMQANFVASQFVLPSGEVRTGITLGQGPDPVPATLAAQASVVHGLFDAARVLAGPAHREEAVRAGKFLVERFWKGAQLFETTLGNPTRSYTPELVGTVLAALRDLKEEGGIEEAGDLHDEFATRMLNNAMVLSEWDEAREVLGDGNPDTDGNGIREATLAGGPHGVSPVFAGRVVAGPPPVEGGVPGIVSWSRHVQPLFRMACAQCHLGGARQGSYSLDTWQGARTHGDSGGKWPMIVAGDPGTSLLFLKTDRRNPPVGVQMPQALPPLSSTGRALIAEWIRQGALNN